MNYTAAEIAKRLDGIVTGDTKVALTGFAPASTAKTGDLTFAENESFFSQAEQSSAAAILVDKDFTSARKTLIRVANARIAFAKVLTIFFPDPVFVPGIHPTAVVARTAQVDPAAHIGPHCVVGERTVIGARVVLHANNFIGDDCRLGDDSIIFPHVTIYPRAVIGRRVRIHAGSVIGADGFGYVVDAGRHLKIPQVGLVVIHDDVEIGANVTIDCGALGPTVIGQGTKIDNLVQIAHNVVIGEHCLVVAQVGIAGSAKLGNYVTIAGQAGIGGHLKVGNQVIVAGQSGVMHDVPDGQKVWGTPAQPDRATKRQLLSLQNLPELLKRVTELERRLAALDGGSKRSDRPAK